MTRFPNRRVVLQTGLGLSMTSLLPMPLWALALDDIPRSEFGAQTTCDEVAAGRDLTGLTVLITGCNSGLGFESMRTLAGQGAHVIGTARTQAKADEACAAVEGKTPPPKPPSRLSRKPASAKASMSSWTNAKTWNQPTSLKG